MRACGKLLFALFLCCACWGAITRTARGTNQTKANVNSMTIANVTIGTTGASLVVGFVCKEDMTVMEPTSITWGATSLVQDALVGNGAVIFSQIWSAHNLTAATNTVTITLTAGQNCSAMSAFATELKGANGVLATDLTATGTGAVNPATTGSITCAPNASANCAWMVSLGVNRPDGDAAPTWTNPNNAGQKIGTTGGAPASNEYSAEGFEIDAGSVTQAASATMATADDYAMAMVTYKEPAGGAAPTGFNKGKKLERLMGRPKC